MRVNAKPIVDSMGDGEIEIEFDSELGRVFILREGDCWRCSVQLAGQGPEGEGSLGADGERRAAYQCFEYLSHLLKHDNLFPGLLSEYGEGGDPLAGDSEDRGAAGEETREKAPSKRGRKKRL